MKILNSIKTKLSYKKILLMLTYLVVAIIVHKITIKMENTKIPYALIGMFGPFIFSLDNDSKISKKILLYSRVLFKIITISLSLVFLLKAYYQNALFLNINTILGLIFLLFAILCPKKIPYTIIGIININLVALVALNENYKLFAIGFITFFVFEAIRGKKMQLLAPFTKRNFYINLKNLSTKKIVVYSIITALMAVIIITTSIINKSFYDVYAKENKRIEQEIEKSEIKNNVKPKIDTIVNKIKNTTIDVNNKIKSTLNKK